MARLKVGTEEALAFQLAQFMQYQHPDLIYHFDYGSGLRMSMGQAIKQKRLNRRAFPDFFLAHPSKGKHGLFLELKKAGTPVVLKDGTLTKNVHIREQAVVLRDLQKAGYEAQFAIGLNHAITLVEKYLDTPSKRSVTMF